MEVIYKYIFALMLLVFELGTKYAVSNMLNTDRKQLVATRYVESTHTYKIIIRMMAGVMSNVG